MYERFNRGLVRSIKMMTNKCVDLIFEIRSDEQHSRYVIADSSRPGVLSSITGGRWSHSLGTHPFLLPSLTEIIHTSSAIDIHCRTVFCYSHLTSVINSTTRPLGQLSWSQPTPLPPCIRLTRNSHSSRMDVYTYLQYRVY